MIFTHKEKTLHMIWA